MDCSLGTCLAASLALLASAACTSDDGGRGEGDPADAAVSAGGPSASGGASPSTGGSPDGDSASGGRGAAGASSGSGGAIGGDGGSGAAGASGGSGGATPVADAGDSGSNPHEGLVPVFLGMGYGTRRVASCDNGLTWPHDEEDVPNGGDDGTLVRGLGYGAARFVAAVGGGGVQQLFTSDDGVAFTRFDRGGNGFSDVSYGNGRFVAGGGHASVISLDGTTWEQPGTMGQGGILRHLAFGDYSGGRFVAVGDRGRRMSSPDGVVWGAELEEGPSLNGAAYGAGVFVAITSGAETRHSNDGGTTWSTGSIPGATSVRGILFDGARFIVTTQGNTFTSANGTAWTEHTAGGGPDSFAVTEDGQHYAGAQGGDLYHSTDGIHFERVKQGGQGITRVKFGWVKPSSVCPAPG